MPLSWCSDKPSLSTNSSHHLVSSRDLFSEWKTLEMSAGMRKAVKSVHW